MIKLAERFDSVRLRPLAERVAWIVEQETARARDLRTPIRLAGLGGTPFRLSDRTAITVDLAALGHDLQVGIERIECLDEDQLGAKVAARVAEHVRLEALRRRADDLGASGWIDGAALRILASSGLPLPTLVTLLERSSVVELSGAIDGRQRCRVTLSWADGVITGAVGRASDVVRYTRSLLELRVANLPETLLAALPGRPLGDLVSHPLIPSDPTIADVRGEGDWLFVEVEESPQPIIAASGTLPTTCSD